MHDQLKHVFIFTLLPSKGIALCIKGRTIRYSGGPWKFGSCKVCFFSHQPGEVCFFSANFSLIFLNISMYCLQLSSVGQVGFFYSSAGHSFVFYLSGGWFLLIFTHQVGEVGFLRKLPCPSTSPPPLDIKWCAPNWFLVFKGKVLHFDLKT